MAAIAITGTIQDASGTAVANAVVRLSPAPEVDGASESIGGIGVVTNPVEIVTASGGTFSMAAIQGFRYLLEIPSIGYSRNFIAPASATIRFDLLGLTPEISSAPQSVDKDGVRSSHIVVRCDAIESVRQRYDTFEVYATNSIWSGEENWGPALNDKGKSKVSLRPNKTFYDFLQKPADEGLYYRAIYRRTENNETSLPGDFMATEDQDEESLLISVDELKALYLFGVDLTKDDGEAFPARMFEHYIRAGVDWVSKELDIPMVAHNIVREGHDHYARDYGRWGYFQLQQYPVIEITKLAFQYPSMTDEVVISNDWIVLAEGGAHGVIQIVPGHGSIADVLLIPGALMPLWSGRTGRVPGIWHFNYRAGFEPATLPPDIKHIIGMWASIGVLNIAGDLIAGAGIANKSVSIPGLSQNIGTTSSATNCLHPDTRIALADGSLPTIAELVGAKPFQVACVDARGNQRVGWAHSARKTIEDDVLAVHLSNDETVLCNATHPFRVFGGKYIPAGELRSGQRLTTCGLIADAGYSIVVERVEPTGEHTWLYDLTVDEYECFGIGQGVVVHNSGYGARIIEYQKEIKEMMPNLRRFYGKNTRMVVV